MYARFDAPKNKDGTPKMIAGRNGILLAHATIGPISPALPDVELSSFGLWDKGGMVSVTVPSGSSGFNQLVPRAVKTTMHQDDGGTKIESVVLAPSLGGKDTLGKLCMAIAAAWTGNPGTRLNIGERIELVGLNGQVPPTPVALPKPASK